MLQNVRDFKTLFYSARRSGASADGALACIAFCFKTRMPSRFVATAWYARVGDFLNSHNVQSSPFYKCCIAACVFLVQSRAQKAYLKLPSWLFQDEAESNQKPPSMSAFASRIVADVDSLNRSNKAETNIVHQLRTLTRRFRTPLSCAAFVSLIL